MGSTHHVTYPSGQPPGTAPSLFFVCPRGPRALHGQFPMDALFFAVLGLLCCSAPSKPAEECHQWRGKAFFAAHLACTALIIGTGVHAVSSVPVGDSQAQPTVRVVSEALLLVVVGHIMLHAAWGPANGPPSTRSSPAPDYGTMNRTTSDGTSVTTQDNPGPHSVAGGEQRGVRQRRQRRPGPGVGEDAVDGLNTPSLSPR